MLKFFCEKDVSSEISKHLRLQKYLGFWLNGIWFVNGPEPSDCFWWSGFKIHFMLKSPNILLLSLLLSHYYRSLYRISVERCRKSVCKFRAGWLGFFCFFWSHWYYIQSDFMNREMFLLGNRFLGKRGKFKKYVPGALNIMWRRTADLKEFPQAAFGVCDSVDGFAR